MSGRVRESLAEGRARRAEIDDPVVVHEAALRFLEARQRSVAEVRRRLTTAGYRADLVTSALDRLGDLGLLDDEAFARAWVESRDRAHPRGEHALMLELRQKGIEARVIAAALLARRESAVRWDTGDGGPGDDERLGGGAVDRGASANTADKAAARKLLARHARSLERVTDPRVRRQRAYALLARNGFAPDVAAEVAREITASENAGDEAAGDAGDAAPEVD